jgi:hypothetical protein
MTSSRMAYLLIGICLGLLLLSGVPLRAQATPGGSATSAPVAAPVPVTAPRQVLKDVLARREFGTLGQTKNTVQRTPPTWWTRFVYAWHEFWAKVGNWISTNWRRLWSWIPRPSPRIESPSGSAWFWGAAFELLRIVFWIVVIGALLYVLGLIISRWFAGREREQAEKDSGTRRTEGAAPAPPTQWEQALAAAEELWASGDSREALRVLLSTSLVLLSTRGVLHYDESRTNGEVLRELRRLGRTDIHDTLRPLARSFDQAWYGFLTVSPHDYTQARDASVGLQQMLIGGKG